MRLTSPMSVSRNVCIFGYPSRRAAERGGLAPARLGRTIEPTPGIPVGQCTRPDIHPGADTALFVVCGGKPVSLWIAEAHALRHFRDCVALALPVGAC